VAQACIIFVIPLTVLNSVKIIDGGEGYPTDMWTMSLAIYYSVFTAVTVNLSINMRIFTYYHLLSIVGMSMLPFIIIVIVSDFKDGSWMNLVIRTAHSQPLFYLTVLCAVGICGMIDFLIYVKDFLYKPDPA
jgi:hypothetical protein